MVIAGIILGVQTDHVRPLRERPLSLRLSVDRYEGDIVVLVTDDGRQVEFPSDLLPAGTKAGDLLRLTIDRDEVATGKLKADTKKVQARLKKRDTGGDIKL